MTDYTQAQLSALALLYREQEMERRRLCAEAESLFSAGNYSYRKGVLTDAETRRCVLIGIDAAARAIGIPSEMLVQAAIEAEGA